MDKEKEKENRHPLEIDIPPSADMNLHYPGPFEGFVIGSVTYLIAWIFGLVMFRMVCAFCKFRNPNTPSRYCHENCKRMNFAFSTVQMTTRMIRKIRFILVFSGRLFTFLVKGVIIPSIVNFYKHTKTFIGGGNKYDDL
jgi:hypothetical protein